MREYRDSGYYVKEDGTVIGKYGKPLKPRLRGSYNSVRIHYGEITKGNINIHRMVAEVYLGECPDGFVVNHKDGNKLNNHKDNLEYVTRSENQKHAYRTGLQNTNERKPMKSRPLGCIQIYKKAGYSVNRLKELFNIPSTTLHRLYNKN